MKGCYWNPVCTKLLRIITQAYQPHSQRAQQNPYFAIYVMRLLADWLRRMDAKI